MRYICRTPTFHVFLGQARYQNKECTMRRAIPILLFLGLSGCGYARVKVEEQSEKPEVNPAVAQIDNSKNTHDEDRQKLTESATKALKAAKDAKEIVEKMLEIETEQDKLTDLKSLKTKLEAQIEHLQSEKQDGEDELQRIANREILAESDDVAAREVLQDYSEKLESAAQIEAMLQEALSLKSRRFKEEEIKRRLDKAKQNTEKRREEYLRARKRFLEIKEKKALTEQEKSSE
jgi:hypothetical protein